MRSYSEATAKNLLRAQLVFGVSLYGMIGLSFLVLSTYTIVAASKWGGCLSLALGLAGYLALRISTRFTHTGSEEFLLWGLERRFPPKRVEGRLTITDSDIEIHTPDALDEIQLSGLKDYLLDAVQGLKGQEKVVFLCEIKKRGAELKRVMSEGKFDFSTDHWRSDLGEIYQGNEFVYSLYSLPVETDPVFLFSVLSKIEEPVSVVVRIEGVDFSEIKRRMELSRRANSRSDARISDVDAEVSFEETTRVLRGLSRGDERVVQISLIIISRVPLDLDSDLWFKESVSRDLAVASAFGMRKRTHRTHLVRAVTATDLIPNILDPYESGASILRTVRGKPLYFSPDDPRLEALHWLVVGASGSGKSFLTGLILKRMIADKAPISALFIDHNRSFRRLVRQRGATFLEPQSISSLKIQFQSVVNELDFEGVMAGIELSDLSQSEKKEAIRLVLNGIETYLRTRKTTHTVYVVLDECWNLMRDEPVLVQRTFREYRKLHGAVIAVTQSLSDFLTDESGQSIFQNAPIRILLRQAEDLSRYQGVLNLNSVELSRVRALRQKKSVFSECLIKTPFLSRFGRLYPEGAEHEELRTDNIRAELILEAKSKCV